MTMQTDNELFDEKQLLRTVFDDIEFLHKLLQIFLRDSSSLLTEISEAIAKANASDLQRKSHSMKNLGRNLSSQILIDISLALEKCGTENSFDHADKLYDELKQLVEKLQESVQRLIERTSD